MGEQQEKTEWHWVVFFNRLAEVVSQYVRKGSKLYIEGNIRTRSWEQDGITKYATEIIGSEMQMLDSRVGGDSNYAVARSNVERTSPQPIEQSGKGYRPVEMDDDLPF